MRLNFYIRIISNWLPAIVLNYESEIDHKQSIVVPYVHLYFLIWMDIEATSWYKKTNFPATALSADLNSRSPQWIEISALSAVTGKLVVGQYRYSFSILGICQLGWLSTHVWGLLLHLHYTITFFVYVRLNYYREEVGVLHFQLLSFTRTFDKYGMFGIFRFVKWSTVSSQSKKLQESQSYCRKSSLTKQTIRAETIIAAWFSNKSSPLSTESAPWQVQIQSTPLMKNHCICDNDGNNSYKNRYLSG